MYGPQDLETIYFYEPTPNMNGERKLDDIIWQQFTGLIDKNGKEIYEGDIVEFEDSDEYNFSPEPKLVRREVKWDTYYGAGWNFGISHKDGEKRWSYPFYEGFFEVIGNIYENEDLLSA